VEADAGKAHGTIECLLIQHRRIKQNANRLGKVALAAVAALCERRLNQLAAVIDRRYN
jgi:hypothetical protein